jgi:hypothetical protein
MVDLIMLLVLCCQLIGVVNNEMKGGMTKGNENISEDS